MKTQIDVYLEIGKKRTFAAAMDWPGWCRSGRDEVGALQALLAYGPRYAQVMRLAGIEFQAPGGEADFHVVERLAGNASTEYGVPEASPAADTLPLEPAKVQRMEALLQACWRWFDAAVAAATGKPLRTGPRGGGRELEEIASHVNGAEGEYLRRLGWKPNPGDASHPAYQRQALLDALEASARGEGPTQGPRGGKIWSARYFVRRVAWHVLDHGWEIEDRAIEG